MLSALAALVNILPYIGPILAAVFPCIVAMITEDSLQPVIWLIIIFSLIQGLDNYFVTPYFLGGEVSLSALATIVMIICGGFLWGIAGMILFVPMLSIAKIIFDHNPALKHYSLLIGDEGKRPSSKVLDWFRKIRNRK
jgi:predicted PurR-regulated permease PerM